MYRVLLERGAEKDLLLLSSEIHDRVIAAIHALANNAHFCSMCGPHLWSMKITEDVRKYAAEQSLSEQEALQKGMEEKSRQFTENGAEVYAKT